MKNWTGLYKLYEIIRSDVGGKTALSQKRWVDEADLIRFTRTADHPSASGRDARHAASNNEPPKVPMSLEEAKRLIRQVGQSWIEHKLRTPDGSLD